MLKGIGRCLRMNHMLILPRRFGYTVIRYVICSCILIHLVALPVNRLPPQIDGLSWFLIYHYFPFAGIPIFRHTHVIREFTGLATRPHWHSLRSGFMLGPWVFIILKWRNSSGEVLREVWCITHDGFVCMLYMVTLTINIYPSFVSINIPYDWILWVIICSA